MVNNNYERKEIVLPLQLKNVNKSSEAVLVDVLGDNRYRLVCSPGWVEGIASGDEIALDSESAEGFRLLKRGGKISVRVYANNEKAEVLKEEALRKITRVSGKMDGYFETKSYCLMVFTFDVSVGFSQIEEIFFALDGITTNYEWYYGNVYDPKDGITPLNWWVG